ncbi:hypothetical protein E4U21_007863 [Claviceps maximensis]|nr:hypothetical protein E4U21_007863 [Claviceps maximensis]
MKTLIGSLVPLPPMTSPDPDRQQSPHGFPEPSALTWCSDDIWALLLRGCQQERKKRRRAHYVDDRGQAELLVYLQAEFGERSSWWHPSQLVRRHPSQRFEGSATDQVAKHGGSQLIICLLPGSTLGSNGRRETSNIEGSPPVMESGFTPARLVRGMPPEQREAGPTTAELCPAGWLRQAPVGLNDAAAPADVYPRATVMNGSILPQVTTSFVATSEWNTTARVKRGLKCFATGRKV